MRDGDRCDRSLHWPHTNASIATKWTRGRDVDLVADQFIYIMRFSFQVQQKAAVTLDTPIAAVSRTQYSLHILWVRFSIKNAVRNQGKIAGQEMKHCPYADGAT